MAESFNHRLAASAETRSACDALLHRSLELTGAMLGNVQLLDWRAGELEIVSQRGFQPDFLRFFERVNYRDSCACGRAAGTRAPVVVGDVMADAAFAPYRDIADRAGFRAVQSTPLLSSSAALVGIVSTHFPAAHAPTLQELASLKEIARCAADAIIAHWARRRLVSRGFRVVRRDLEKAEEFRQYAAECRERAVHSNDIGVRRQLLEIAEQWRELADHTDRDDVLHAPIPMKQ